MQGAWRRRRFSLAGQMLAFQLGIVLLVLIGVGAVSIAQLAAAQRSTEGRRALSLAEFLVSSPGVRESVVTGEPGYLAQARSAMTSNLALTGATRVTLTDARGRIIAATDPPVVGQDVQRSDAFNGRSWTGTEDGTGDAMAMAPIIEVASGSTIGVVTVSRAYPSVLSNLRSVLPNLLTYVGLASLLAIVGSYLLSQRVKRQTLGLEPREITGLVEHREALLSGIKEGVLAVDLDRRLTMVNEQAAGLLGIPMLSVGASVTQFGDHAILATIFDDDAPTTDRVLPVGPRLVTVNRMPVQSRGRQIGWVATLRDRTALVELQRELDLNRSATDLLRAQAHEFSNRMHVVTGLITIEEYDEARTYIQQITEAQSQLAASVTESVTDPAVAALVLAKVSQAGERGVRFTIAPTTRLPRMCSEMSADVNTVLGNLVDNAFDAAAASADPHVDVELRTEAFDEVEVVVVTVRDSGPGVDATVAGQLFERGFTTKQPVGQHGHGIGLALVQVVCRARGGDVEVHNDGGAVFVATLRSIPLLAASDAASP